MNSIKNRVEHLMRLDSNFRNSDKALVLQVWKEYGLELSAVQIDKFRMAPSAEVITRRRRELSHKYPASAKVTEQRYKHYKGFTDEFSHQNFIIRLLKRKGI